MHEELLDWSQSEVFLVLVTMCLLVMTGNSEEKFDETGVDEFLI